jgi:nucleoside-diphosphate-sugar epimerase
LRRRLHEDVKRDMRVLMIGATGHVGTYLIPALVRGGHDVVALSRGTRAPYHADPAWKDAERVLVDREAQEADGTFVRSVLATRPDAVIDMVCFEPSSAKMLVAGLTGHVGRLLMCGTIWVHGPTRVAPTRESDPRHPYGDYGVKKTEIERLVLASGIESVVLHPGHISGPGWPVINPVGNLDLAVWQALADGHPVAVPGEGVATLHHVAARDVAQAFELALESAPAVGEAFHIVSERAVSTRGLAEEAASWFGRRADLRLMSWPDFAAQTTPEHVAASREHLQRSHVMSIDKARELLGYSPEYSSFAAVHEAVDWLVAEGQIRVPVRP